ncbi:MAG: response regulator [Spirochaetota bacterium]
MKKVLIAEDEGLLALQLRMRIKEWGLELCGCITTADEAVAAAQNLRPDVILMDIRLARHSDGMDAARRIRAFSTIPIVFISGYTEEALKEEARRLAPSSYMEKPVMEKEVFQVIKSHLGD